LDAIEANPDKKIAVDNSGNVFKVFDNGAGLSVADVQEIYDFDNYVSRNRHIINISRGKQGNGLKTIIGICQLCGYRLLWHTNESIIVCPYLETKNAQEGEIDIEFNTLEESTEYRGVEIRGTDIDNNMLDNYVDDFAECNPDVAFYLNLNGDECTYESKTPATNKQSETSLLFYDLNTFKRLLDVQNPDMTYKKFLGETFGTRVKNASDLTGKIKDIYLHEVIFDFNKLRTLQNRKPLTLLKKHLIGYKNIIEAYPYIIEYDSYHSEDFCRNSVMINNSITYLDASSVVFAKGEYQITASKKVDTSNLEEILNNFKNYYFVFHIITPNPSFKDFGKTQIDISDISHTLVEHIRKTVNKAKRRKPANKPKTKKDLAFQHMDEGFNLASSGGKYSITARQMYYKIRELIGDDEWETPNTTYTTFTQDWLTQWLDDNPQHENRVNFSDRGTFIVDGVSKGIGSANVRNFITDNKSRTNRLTLDADIAANYLYDFDVKYKYDKALYIEKTGFNEIFIAEGVQEKHKMLIVSGQGYGSRSARQLLYDLQQKGLKIYCMHDLDIHGMGIINSLSQANDKFKYDIEITDLGVTLADVARYNIIPEKVKAAEKKDLSGLSEEHQRFFQNVDGYSQRVELNAFTTEQLLQIIDDKLSGINRLPKFNISAVVRTNEQKLKEYALFKLVRNKYGKMLNNITVGDFAANICKSGDSVTYYEMLDKMPEIENSMMNGLMAQLDKMREWA
jgi:hypothetical protein